ncbi:MAG: DUF1573 domain-containing protein [Geobacteraceae bacterium]|nr:DUF1573 domain-containing protein [Geobacteraceae bacterium]
MKFRFIPFFLTAALVSLFHSLPALAAPQLAFDKPVHNFKDTTQGTTIVHSFTFRNTGTEPATIEKVTSSCGCTVADISERVVRPGKRGEIKASFDTSDFSGPVSKQIYVFLSGSKAPAYTLSLKGNIIEELVVTPPQVNLGELKAGVRKVATVKLENKGKRTIRIREIQAVAAQMTASADKRSLKPGETATIRISLVPRMENRFLGGYLSIKTDAPGKGEKNVQVFGTVRK